MFETTTVLFKYLSNCTSLLYYFEFELNYNNYNARKITYTHKGKKS